MKIIITGGSGLIGKALTKKLIDSQHEVVILSRDPDGLKDIPAPARAVQWTGQDLGEWTDELEGADAVVNLAGASIAGDSPLKMRWTPKRKRVILESRILAGETIALAISKAMHKPKVLLQASAVGIYGPKEDEIVDESFPVGNDFLAEVCRRWEDSIGTLKGDAVRRVILRTGLVFSARGGLFPLLKLPFLFFMGGQIGSGKQYMPWIHIEDHVRAILFLIKNQNTQGVYNLSSPEPERNKDFGRKLGRSINRPSIVPVPNFLIQLALGEAATLALDGQRVVPKRLLEAGFSFNFPTLEKALSDLKRVAQ